MTGDHGHRHHGHRHAPGEQDWGELGAHLELEGEVLSPYLDEAMAVLQALVRSGAEGLRRIVDVGCGPDVATAALVKAFPNATLIALDRAPALLKQVRDRADRLGVGHRVTTVSMDLDQATLAVLTDPTDRRSVMQRPDVEVHVGRSLYVARRPGCAESPR